MGQNEKYSEMRKKPMEYRKVFDTIPEQFDKFRPRYSAELFEYFIRKAGIGTETKVLEIGPGTGQATDPILDTGCDYNAIELGEHLYEKMKEKYDTRPNFHIVNDDFITHDFGEQRYDVIYSAATIQWIPEKVAFSKTFELLKPGGTLAMMFLIGDYKSPNEELFNNIQKVYDEYYKPVTEYKNMKEPFDYLHATDYGYVDLKYFAIMPWFRGRGLGVQLMREINRRYADAQGIVTELTEFPDEDKDRVRKLRKFFNRFGYEEVKADCSIAGVRDNLYVKPLRGGADLTPVIHRVLPDFYTRFMPASAVYRMLEFK